MCEKNVPVDCAVGLHDLGVQEEAQARFREIEWRDERPSVERRRCKRRRDLNEACGFYPLTWAKSVTDGQ